MLRLIAYEMQAGEEGLKGNLISADRLIRVLTDYLRDQGFSEPREKANLLIQQLRERNFILCYRGADTYGFVHRTFLEYFCAVEIVYCFEKQRSITFEQLRDEIFGRHWRDDSWNEVLRLISGILDPTFSYQLIEFLMNLLPIKPIENLQPGDELTEEYLYLNEYLNLSIGLDNIILAADCFREIKNYRDNQDTTIKIIKRLQKLINFISGYPGDFSQFELDWSIDLLIQLVETISDIGAKNFEIYNWLFENVKASFLQEICITAIDEISNKWSHHTNVIQDLCEIILRNKYTSLGDSGDEKSYFLPSPRQVALYRLSNLFPKHPKALEHLHDCSINDPDDHLREWARRQLLDWGQVVSVST